MEHEPLHPLCLAGHLLRSLEFNPLPTSSARKPELPGSPLPPTDEPQPSSKVSNLGCTTCRTQFDSHDLQRQHFRSDWHRFNLKLTTNNPSHVPINQDEFVSRLESLDDSLSGSDDSDSSSEHSSDDHHPGPNDRAINLDKFNELFIHNDHRFSQSLPEDAEQDPVQLLLPSSPVVWFNGPSSLSPPSQTSQHPESSSSVPETDQVVQLGFYRCIFPKAYTQDRALRTHHQDQLGKQYKSELLQLQHDFLPSNFSSDHLLSHPQDLDTHTLQKRPPIWTFLMVGGGHFAAMVVSAIPKLRHVGKHKPPEMEPVILHHKTFHRYTTRRKQGGGQASHDAGGKGAAKSAGASLRRYNEQALSEDIQDLLKSWSDSIQNSDLIFVRSSKSNLKLFLKSNKNQENDDLDRFKLDRGDDRIRSFPFVTKRPTFNELKRCLNELTRVKVIKTSKQEILEKETELRAAYEREKNKREVQIKKKVEQEERARLEEERKRKEKVPKEKTPEEKEREIQTARWERIIDLVKKGKLEQLQEFVKKYEETRWLERMPEMITEETSMTNGCESLLQIGAMSDQAEVVEWMLSDGKSDPTMKGSKEGAKGNLTAYEMAGQKSTRNAFRRVMAREPGRWEWVKGARVPSGLTEELASSQALKSKEWKNKLKEKIKERDRLRAQNEQNELELARLDAQKRAQDDARVRLPRPSPVNRLGAPGRPANVVSQAPGLSDAQLARLERERRARAAEARLQR